MAAATAGYEWSRSSPLQHSPDTTSPMYPDRPIRPLPKRRLRARLSPEQADSIVYPPAPPSSAPLFSFPYSQLDKVSGVAASRVQRGDHEPHTCHCGHDHSELDSDEEEDDRAAALQSSPSVQPYSRSLLGTKSGASAAFSKPSSASSSADGYESFENTNNKKKRKIPNMGSISAHHNNLTAEMASMGISHARDPAAHDDGEGGVGHYYGSGSSAMQTSSSGTGISGAGRGRYARSGRTPERRVLGTSTNAMNAGKTTSGAKRDYNGAGNPPEQGGIISAAIANAQAEQSQAGNENVSLLQQQAAKTPDNSQFTFSIPSDSANKMVWPGQQNGNFAPPDSLQARGYTNAPEKASHRGGQPQSSQPRTTQGTQTSPNMNGNQQASSKPQPQAQPGAQQPRKPRRKPGKIYALAARQRKLQQEYTNYHHPPSREDIWICEFCEYESIFGSPPEALVRQYEIKDRKERKRLAEKRRLLEKARMKGRKGKKGTKNAAKNNANANQQAQNPPPNQRYDQPLDNAPLDQQEEEYYDDEYDDIPALAPADNAVQAHAASNGYHENHPPGPNLRHTSGSQARGGGKAANGA
ncbi:uncharacterized protein BDZ99DRAFT_489679 [Mytilinidion resinicola]|uniref:Uncharacterized protein n=1 Tax=Mytilinidion resinicola TaxID=574789 RepID=A0A6A6YGT8_9PEZI|nr:uncharacterized protein BDZ99DRAFT_489679 [Mytilinidion resinicola]KAF2807224.1 hypothetical protein BDZ99DRAFT_489679 [Mytilinidion resinicola]